MAQSNPLQEMEALRREIDRSFERVGVQLPSLFRTAFLPGCAARVSEQDLRSFNTFLDSHDETAQELYRNPDLINDRQFVRSHDALHDWLKEHPDGAAAIQANPDKFLWRERSTGAADFLRQFLK